MKDMTRILVGEDFIAIKEGQWSYWPENWRLTPDESITLAEMENMFRLEGREQAWG